MGRCTRGLPRSRAQPAELGLPLGMGQMSVVGALSLSCESCWGSAPGFGPIPGPHELHRYNRILQRGWACP